MGNRIAGDAVGAALKKNELRPAGLEMLLDPFPRGIKSLVSGTRFERQIQLGAGRLAPAGFIGVAGPGYSTRPSS